MKQNISFSAYCNRRQRVYGIIALVGLFACGLMVGISIGAARRGAHADDARSVESVAQMPAVEKTSDKETCVVIEEMISQWILPETVDDVMGHRQNIDSYERLIAHGCPENKEKYQKLIEREHEIIAALTGQESSEQVRTCAEIERRLEDMLGGYSDNVERAKIYANLSERGCPENAAKYANQAARELEIARALNDDKFNNDETVEVVETYKRIQMKQAAQDVINKVQKLTDPAIDFIMELNKIINE